jgi:hypothetical protein
MTVQWRSFCEERQKDVIEIGTEIGATETDVDLPKVFVAGRVLFKTEFKANYIH